MQTYSETKIESWLVWFLRGLTLFVFFVVIGRLTELQIIRGGYYRLMAEGNRIRRVPIIAARGRILARGGEILVGNKEVKKKIIFEGSESFSKTSLTENAKTEDLIVEWQREYFLGNSIAHISGYLGEANEEEVGKIRAQCPEKGPLKLGSWVGRSGLEESYDCVLGGIDGEELIEVDTFGNKVRILGIKNPIPGEDIKTNIDYNLQIKVAELMQGKTGAVVIEDEEGEIIALYSSPSYDPNIFVKDDKNLEVSKTLNDKSLPMFNRVISGTYHPGSTFKPLVAIAALEEGKIDKNFVYNDTGRITFDTPYGSYSYANWFFTQYGKVEGEIKLTKAISRSTDTFFYKIGELTGVEALDRWAAKFRLDSKTGLDLPGENSGLIPSPEWKLKVKGERWFLGNTYHMSIGQGDVALTPIGVNTLITTISNNGKFCPPHIINLYSISKVKNLSLSNYQCKDFGIKKENIDLVKEGMTGACSVGGTGYTFFDFADKHNAIKVACKTGTAEVGDGTKDTHAWFTAFAPVESPEVIATVLIERGGEGSRVAGPIAREIFDYWFGNSNKN